jgi:hypothetical protein
MLNLLIREDRYEIRREYLNRVFNLFLLITCFLLIIYLGVLHTTYLAANFEAETVFAEENKIKNSNFTQDYLQYVNLVEHLESEYELLRKDKNIDLLFYLQEIEKNLVSGILLNFINLNVSGEFNKNQEVLVEIRGNSINRDSLLAFIKKLEDLVGKENIESPLSNFVQSGEAAFYLKVKFLK